jgi:hypothetical protein
MSSSAARGDAFAVPGRHFHVKGGDFLPPSYRTKGTVEILLGMVVHYPRDIMISLHQRKNPEQKQHHYRSLRLTSSDRYPSIPISLSPHNGAIIRSPTNASPIPPIIRTVSSPEECLSIPRTVIVPSRRGANVLVVAPLHHRRGRLVVFHRHIVRGAVE